MKTRLITETLQESKLELKTSSLQRKLSAALEYANNICILGAENKIADYERTHGWCLFPKYRYEAIGRYLKFSDGKFSLENDSMANSYFESRDKSLQYSVKKWYYHVDDLNEIKKHNVFTECVHEGVNPLQDPQFKLQPSHLDLLCGAMMAIGRRGGTCGNRSRLVAKYLWEHPEGINRIELVNTKTFDHVFVVVNRSGDDIKNPDTWGNALIIDAWYRDKGIIYPASEFREKIKEIKQFAKDQVSAGKKIGLSFSDYIDEGEDVDQCSCEIQPSRDCYPSYSNIPIEDYYILENIYPTKPNPADNMRTILHETQREHKEKFNACLKEIAAFDEKKTHAFFQSKKIKSVDKVGEIESKTNTHKRKFAIESGPRSFPG